MWIYIKANNKFLVGFYTPNNRFVSESQHEKSDEAAARVHYLNGGNILTRIELKKESMLHDVDSKW